MYSKEEIKDKIFLGHVLEELKKYPDNCLDMAVTSPPYFSCRYYGKEINTVWDSNDPDCEHEWKYYVKSNGIRQPLGILKGKRENVEFTKGHKTGYCMKCGAWYGQLGQEPTPTLYIKHLADIFDELKRALKSTGLFFLNIDDVYAGSHSGYGNKIPNPKSLQDISRGYSASSVMKPPAATCVGSEDWIKHKTLMLIPYRLAIEMQNRGWILRASIIWRKRTHLPMYSLDNFDCKAYENIFMFSKESYYFFNKDDARRPYSDNTYKRQKYKVTQFGTDGIIKCTSADKDSASKPAFIHPNPKGAPKTNIWSIKVANTKLKHFAAFAEELVQECILPGCAKEVCSECGKPKMVKYKMITRDFDELMIGEKEKYNKILKMPLDSEELRDKILGKLLRKKISLGFIPTCKCKVGFDNGIVFDPFMGSGTTAVTARKLGYHYSGIEMQPKYHKMIMKRLKEML